MPQRRLRCLIEQDGKLSAAGETENNVGNIFDVERVKLFGIERRGRGINAFRQAEKMLCHVDGIKPQAENRGFALFLEQRCAGWVVIRFLIMIPSAKQVSDLSAVDQPFRHNELMRHQTVVRTRCLEIRVFLRTLKQFETFGTVDPERFFAEDMPTGFQSPFRELNMSVMRSCNINTFRIAFGERLFEIVKDFRNMVCRGNRFRFPDGRGKNRRDFGILRL